jgi:hypothetical protein
MAHLTLLVLELEPLKFSYFSAEQRLQLELEWFYHFPSFYGIHRSFGHGLCLGRVSIPTSAITPRGTWHGKRFEGHTGRPPGECESFSFAFFGPLKTLGFRSAPHNGEQSTPHHKTQQRTVRRRALHNIPYIPSSSPLGVASPLCLVSILPNKSNTSSPSYPESRI